MEGEELLVVRDASAVPAAARGVDVDATNLRVWYRPSRRRDRRPDAEQHLEAEDGRARHLGGWGGRRVKVRVLAERARGGSGNGG